MSYINMLWEWPVDGTDSGLFPVVGFGISTLNFWGFLPENYFFGILFI
jgi:hypothetical protein